VRWTGFFLPTMSDVYTFFIQKTSGETSTSLTIDNGASISVSDGATEGSGTFFVPAANQLYELTLQLLSTNSATAVFRLLWLNDGNTYINYDRPAVSSPISAKKVIGRDSLYRIRTNSRVVRDDQSRYYDAAGWPDCGSTSTGNALRWYQCRGQGVRTNDVLSVEVKPGLIGSASSVTIVTAVTSATAGVTGTFDVVAKDEFGNILDTDSDAILIKISLDTGSEAPFYGSAVSTSTGATAGNPKGRYSVAYVVTRSGTFSLTIAAVGRSGNGLMGSFFNTPSFSGATATLTASSIDFNWGSGSPVPQLPATDGGWSARWTGFLRLVDTASTMYSFYLGTGYGGGRLYVGNKLVVDSTNVADDYKLGGEFSGTVSLASNVVYDVTVEYVAAAVPAYLTLSYSSYSQAKIRVPSAALFPFASTFSNGAQTLTVVDFRRNCGASSLVNGPGLTVATAGVSAIFTITSVDQYGNRRSSQSVQPDCSVDATCVFASVAVPDDASATIRPFRGVATLQSTNEFFNVAYTVTRSAGYSLSIASSPFAGGLWATYYDDVGWTGPRLSQQQADPNWSIGSGDTTVFVPTQAAAALSKDTLWSVRHRGFFKPTTTGQYTFAFSVTEKLKAYVDGALLVDTYSTGYSGVATSVTGTINIPATNAFYEIHLMYETDSSSGSTFSATINAGVTYLSAAANLYSSTFVAASPYRDIVYPNLPCGTQSSINGVSLTLATAGVLARFTVTLRDEYGNLRDDGDGLLVVSAFPLTGSAPITPTPNFLQGTAHTGGNTCASCPTAPQPAAVSDGSSIGLYNVQITLTKTGNYKIAASIARPGGLSASYYARDATVFQYSSTFGSRSMFGSLDYTTTVAIAGRWQGFVRPSRAGSYTFSVEPYSSSETSSSFKLWVSQTLVIDRTTPIPGTGFSAVFSFPYANNLYDVFVAYNSPASGTAGFRLWWQSSQVPQPLISQPIFI